MYQYFSEEEFTRCNPPCKLSDMQESFMNRLEYARAISQTPYVINSAYRSVEYEISKGRKGTSSHCKGCAVDIKCKNSIDRVLILSGLLSAGFRRIGLHKHFIHVDSDAQKNASLWLY